jgi:signal transduction histidine kinase
MLFDDRLATVLRNPAQSEPAVRTQYRQLLDLLGSARGAERTEWVEAAYARLGELAQHLPAAVQSAILRTPGLRLRDRTLVAWLAEGEPQAAAAVMATAELTENDWLYLIPRLPMSARGFLRHRRGLPFSARQVLERLGVGDLVLPEPESMLPAANPGQPIAAPEPESPAPEADESDAGISALVKRIEAFQRTRRQAPAPAPPRPADPDYRPLPEAAGPGHRPLPEARTVDFASDARGQVIWADPAVAPLVVGLILGPARPGAVAQLDQVTIGALAQRRPIRGGRVELDGLPLIAGAWRIDAAPVFTPEAGQFAGYEGRLRRASPVTVSGTETAEAPTPVDGGGDRIRQVLHELRTPVNAIQGFAELIQQQMFGPTPNEYRALAAAVAVDAARLMAAFDEIDRLARLETGALDLAEGESDWREVTAQILRRLESALRPRSARIELTARGSPFAVAIEQAEAMQLAWRLLATVAGAMAPGEIIDLALSGTGTQVVMEADLPAAMLASDDLFAATTALQPRAISAGMFGAGFALRLARAEAEAAGGTLEAAGECLRLTLPALTRRKPIHTLDSGEHGSLTAA